MDLDVQLIIDALEEYKLWYTGEDSDEEDEQRVKDIDAELKKLYGVEKIEI